MAKDEFNCTGILPRVCGVSNGEGRCEETSGTLLTPSNPREAIGNDLYGFCCGLVTILKLYINTYSS